MFTQDQIRQIEWSRNYLWDVQFPGLYGAPPPFNTWFPATDIKVDEGVLETESFDIFVTSFSIPARTKERTLSLTFVDDAKHTLIDWIKNWMSQIVNYSGVSTLDQATKQIDITRLDNRRNSIKRESYNVYPEGTIQFLGGSEDAKANSYTVNFIIAGVIA
jgi:hypothetical protein